MNKKLKESKDILTKIGMPIKQTSDICCYTLLAMANLKNNINWNDAKNYWIRIHDIIAFIASNYKVKYAENSRETFRKQALHHFRNAAIVEDNGKATNSPNYKYRLTQEFLELLKDYKTETWDISLNKFLETHTKLVDLYASKKKRQKMPVKINGQDFSFSTGKHNLLQKFIIEDFAPRFAENAEVLYVGDTQDKDLFKDDKKLKLLGFKIGVHNKMPDVVLYCADKKWLYFIEAVTSVGPMEPKRIIEINEMTAHVKVGKIFVTAFLDLSTYKKFMTELAWDTEVWIAEIPEHMIHLNGDKFLGPRNN